MKNNLFLTLTAALLFWSCSDDTEKAPVVPELTDEVLVYEPEKISDNLVLVSDAGADEVYLLQKDGKKFHEWTLTNELGNDAYLEDSGKLLALLKTDNDKNYIWWFWWTNTSY